MTGEAPTQPTGVDPSSIGYRVHAHAFNVLGQSLAIADRFVPLSEREAIASAVVAAIEPLIREDERKAAAASSPDPQPDVTVDQLTAALDGKDILVSVGTGAEVRKPVRPHDLAVQLLEAVDAQRAASGIEVAKRAERGPQAVTMEIIERGSKTTDSLAGSVIIPNEVRINGVPVLTSADEPLTVHRIDFPNREAAMVTLTLFVRKLVVAAEGDL